MLVYHLLPTPVCFFLLLFPSTVNGSPVDPRWGLVNYKYVPERSSFSIKRLSVKYDEWSYFVTIDFGNLSTQQFFLIDTTTSTIQVNTKTLMATAGLDIRDSGSFKHETKNSPFFPKNQMYPDKNDVIGSEMIKIGGRKFRIEFKMVDSLDPVDSWESVSHIVGLGLDDSTENYEDPTDHQTPTYSSLITLLSREGFISHRGFSLWLAGAGDLKNGALLFGAIDTDKFYGMLRKVPMVDQFSKNLGVRPKSMGIELNGILGASTLLASVNQPVLLDTSKPMSYLPFPTVKDLVKNLDAEEHDGMYWVDCKRGPMILYLNFSGAHVSIDLSSFFMPGRDGEKCQLAIAEQLNHPFSLGNTILKAMYIVFDLESYEVGLSEAKSPEHTANEELFPICDGIPNAVSAPNYIIPSVKDL